MLRKCPSNKIYNPDTGKCVNSTSQTGMLVRLAELEERLTGFSDIDNIKNTLVGKIKELEEAKNALDNRTSEVDVDNNEINLKLQKTVKDLEKAQKNAKLIDTDNIKLLRRVDKYESQLNELAAAYEMNKVVINSLINEKDVLNTEIMHLKGELEAVNARNKILLDSKEKEAKNRQIEKNCDAGFYYHYPSKKCIEMPKCRENEWYSYVNHTCRKLTSKNNIIIDSTTDSSDNFVQEAKNEDITTELIETIPNESKLDLNDDINITPNPSTELLSPDMPLGFGDEQTNQMQKSDEKTTNLESIPIQKSDEKTTNLEPIPNQKSNENNIESNPEKKKVICKDNEYFNFKLKRCLPKKCPPGEVYSSEEKKCVKNANEIPTTTITQPTI